jgi:hypothetical protein
MPPKPTEDQERILGSIESFLRANYPDRMGTKKHALPENMLSAISKEIIEHSNDTDKRLDKNFDIIKFREHLLNKITNMKTKDGDPTDFVTAKQGAFIGAASVAMPVIGFMAISMAYDTTQCRVPVYTDKSLKEAVVDALQHGIGWGVKVANQIYTGDIKAPLLVFADGKQGSGRGRSGSSNSSSNSSGSGVGF